MAHKKILTLAAIFSIYFISAIAPAKGIYDITTVYKYGTNEVYSYAEDKIQTTYSSENCTVFVHTQSNAIGMPIYIARNSVENRTIHLDRNEMLTLDCDDTQTEWKTLNSDFLQETDSLTNITLDYASEDTFSAREIWKIDQTLFSEKKIELHEKTISSQYDNYYYSYSDMQKTVFDTETMKTVKHRKAYLSLDLRNLKQFTILFLSRIDVFKIFVTPYSLKFSHSDYSYTQGSQALSRFYIIFDRTRLTIVDTVTSKRDYIELQKQFDISDCSEIKIEYTRDRYFTFDVKFTLGYFQRNIISDNTTLVSPNLDNLSENKSLHIIYYKTNDYGNLTASVRHQTGQSQTLEAVSETQIDKNILNNVTTNLLTVNILFPKDWTNDKRILIKADRGVFVRYIWPSNQQETIKVIGQQSCSTNFEQTKSKAKIYDVVLIDTPVESKSVFCMNGGILSNAVCACPPGFTGENCEIPCGQHQFGRNCSSTCSESFDECQGLLLCTPQYGCACASGYHQEYCNRQCSPGFYGSNCEQKCGHCRNGCDIYTGYCTDGCISPHLKPPYCQESRPYFKQAPRIVDSNYTSVLLKLDLTDANIERSIGKPTFYFIQYKEIDETAWCSLSLNSLNQQVTQYVVTHLKPGHVYLFRTLLLDDSLETQDPSAAKIAQGATKCQVFQTHCSLNVLKVTNSSISLAWEEENVSHDLACPRISYTVEIENVENSLDQRIIKNIKHTPFKIDGLHPEKTYRINLKKNTVMEKESGSIANATVKTYASKGDDIKDIFGLSVRNVNNFYLFQWFRNSGTQTYFVKYKLRMSLSCQNTNSSTLWQTKTTTLTKHSLNLEANALYDVLVTGKENQQKHTNPLTILTDGKLPETSPEDLRIVQVTHENAVLEWTRSPSNCEKLNGLFVKFNLEVYTEQNDSTKTYETTANRIMIAQLSSKTNYKIKLRYVNHIGMNPDYYTETNFTTKSSAFLRAENLTAYKTSKNLIGLRWKLPQTDTTITGVSIKVENKLDKQTMNYSAAEIPSHVCTAWPDYQCYYVTHGIKPKTNHSLFVNIHNDEYPEGSWSSPIFAIAREDKPLPISDLQVVNITDTNMTISWRIPLFLNGILRKFLIEVEHVSSHDEELCCQALTTINYIVSEEKQNYAYTITNIANASSYQVKVRAFTKKFGDEVSKCIDVPPSLLPITQIPMIKVSENIVKWPPSTKQSISIEDMELITDKLIIVQPVERNETIANLNIHMNLSIQNELNKFFNSNTWWLAHVCYKNEAHCNVDIGTQDGTETEYGITQNQMITPGHKYIFFVVQINKYLSASSYTILKSEEFVLKYKDENVSIVNTTKQVDAEITPSPVLKDLVWNQNLQESSTQRNMDENENDKSDVEEQHEDYVEEKDEDSEDEGDK